MTSELPKISVAETLAAKIAALKPGALPAATTRKCEDLLIDVVGLCVTARNEGYIRSALAGCDVVLAVMSGAGLGEGGTAAGVGGGA